MTGRILITYISRTGTTAEIAQAIARDLETSGEVVDVTDMKEVSSLRGYRAVVIGGPVYMGNILKDVKIFVMRYRMELLQMPVAAFAVGFAPVDPKIGTVEEVLEKLRLALDPVRPVATTVFAGRLDPTRLSFVSRKLVAFMKAPTGDFRDWDAIGAWAKSLPAVLKKKD
ncbi:MAG: flavodoxin domain-containing protein [Methanomicrobiales archaeon]|nr:flavodoxin domain-containing protein [Methanomicrobiales archaeon]